MKKLSKTPRSEKHSRQVQFSVAMRKKLSENWVKVRKGMFKKKKRK